MEFRATGREAEVSVDSGRRIQGYKALKVRWRGISICDRQCSSCSCSSDCECKEKPRKRLKTKFNPSSRAKRIPVECEEKDLVCVVQRISKSFTHTLIVGFVDRKQNGRNGSKVPSFIGWQRVESQDGLFNFSGVAGAFRRLLVCVRQKVPVAFSPAAIRETRGKNFFLRGARSVSPRNGIAQWQADSLAVRSPSYPRSE